MRRALLALAMLFVAAPAAAQKYRFPMELPTSGTQPYVTAYRDEDTGAGLKDWNCGTTTYNGHKGSDFGIGSWPVMDAGSRWAVAAADGKVIFVNDGCADHCSTGDCGCGSGFGNYVRLQHADGNTTTYGHLMLGSLVVANGATVKCGDHLGKVGSSGNSTGPHLHFEPRNSGATSLEPFAGSCGASASLWLTQGAYKALPADQCENPTPPEVDSSKLATESPSGTLTVAPGANFQKSWVLDNDGNTTWSTAGGYSLAQVGGDVLGATLPADLGAAESIKPGAQKNWALAFVAPTTPGNYSGDYRMDRTGKGAFGATLHVEVVVANAGAGGASSGGGTSAGGNANGGSAAIGAGGSALGGGGTKPGLGGGSAATSAAPSTEDVEGGCSCRATGPSRPLGGAGFALALLVLGARRKSEVRSRSLDERRRRALRPGR